MESNENGNFLAGGAGLGVVVGSLQERVNRLREELARAESDLLAADETDRGELSSVDQRQQTAIDGLTRTVTALATRVTELENKVTAKPSPAPPPLPQRQTKERNQEYYPRVANWAAKVGKSAPPKPTIGEKSTDYDRRIQRWAAGGNGTGR